MQLVRRFLSVALALTSIPALAWDDTGHRIIGHIAYLQLTEAEQTKLIGILATGDQQFNSTTQDKSLLLAAATTFPDVIKGNQNSIFEREINYYNDWAFPVQLRKPNNKEATRMRVWHYINRPLHTQYLGNKIDHAPFDAVKAINFINAQYPKEQTDRMKSFWIAFSSHIIGDIHQPLHTAASCQHDARGDAGGNFFKLSGDPSNLHYLWDSGITDGVNRPGWRGGNIEKAKKIIEMYPSESFGTQITDLNPDHWANEGAKLAEKFVYTGITQNSSESLTYREQRMNLSLQQAALGGYRLASILKQLLK